MNSNFHWVFDYDGVIGNTLPAIVRFCMHTYQIDEAQARRQVREYAAKPRHCKRTRTEESEAWARKWNSEFGRFIANDTPPVFDGFVQVLERFPHIHKAIVSNNSEQSIRPAIANLALEFTPVLGLEHHHSKEERIAMIATKWKVDLEQICFLTDTVADVLEVGYICYR